MMFAQYTLALLLLAVYYGSVSALRFAHNPVTVDTEASKTNLQGNSAQTAIILSPIRRQSSSDGRPG